MGVERHGSFASDVKPTVVAIQYGGLSVVAPWLDISQPLALRGCFRFDILHGQVAVPTGVADDGSPMLHCVAGDTAIIETQATEIVSDFSRLFPPETRDPGTTVHLDDDACEEVCDWVLVSGDRAPHKLLMRVLAGKHSRMVELSRAMVQLSRVIRIPA
jgi:hypothetical protein